jgi:hypothetical protein
MSQQLTYNAWAEQLRELIRYLASGFVAINVSKFLDIENDFLPHKESFISYSVTITNILYLTNHAIHFVICDDFSYKTALKLVISNKEMNTFQKI